MTAAAAGFGHHGSDVVVAIPFAGLLLSIAFFPLLAPRWWEHHFGKVTAIWIAIFVAAFVQIRGWRGTAHDILHALALDYLPFILLLFALFTVAGGIRVVGNLRGDPRSNTAVLAVGTLAASLLGTTGAAMLLLRPLIGANAGRRHNAHVFVFFIFLVGNIGGSLTPLGDPPLFLGFLRGVDFLWTARAMPGPMALAAGILLGLFFAIDSWCWRRDPVGRSEPRMPRRVRVEGGHNGIYLGAIVTIVLASGLWRPGIAVPVGLGVTIPLEGLVRDAVLATVGLLSWRTTAARIRIENAFTWLPIREVAILFLGIFVTIVPVLAILGAGRDGPAAPLLGLVFHPDGRPDDAAFFWLTGLLSSVLDNAPTYLVFFNLAGGDPAVLMGTMSRTLLAISMGAVFMGANTYLGNAPNFMIKAICEERGIRMPSFFGYMVWSGVILVPVFAILTAVFLRP